MDSLWDAYWETNIRDDGWVQIDNFVIPATLSERKTVWRTFRELEDLITMFGLLGWIMWTKIGNAPIIKAIHRFGGKEYRTKDGRVFLCKLLRKEG